MSSKLPLDRLEEYVSKGAAHDSAERGLDAPKCFPETREAVQEESLSFVDPGGEENVMWLSGPAGAGKTAIMGSIADACHRRKWLAGSFFFSTSASILDRCSKKYLIPTLAYHFFQLKIPGLPSAILASIEANPSVFDKRLDQQVEILLLEPLREVIQNLDLSTCPKVVLVDGVDECSEDHGRPYATKDDRQKSKEANQREVLSALIYASNDPAFPFRVIVASRPESAIEQYFASLPTESSVKRVFLDDKYSPEADIELYTRAMLTKIGLDRGLGGGWFSQVGQSQDIADVPKYVAEESSGQFIYAATVTRFVQETSNAAPKQLERVLNWKGSNTSKPFAALDALYLGILRTSPAPGRAAFFIDSPRYLEGRPFWYIIAFLESFVGEVRHLLAPLSSLIRIVDSAGEPDFHLYHKSLTDFLWDPERSCGLCIKGLSGGFMCDRTYDIMKNRGPQIPLPGNSTIDEFISHYRRSWTADFPVGGKYQYTADDVEWVLAGVHEPQRYEVPTLYRLAHEKCGQFVCEPGCKVWRKGISRFTKANGLPSPPRTW